MPSYCFSGAKLAALLVCHAVSVEVVSRRSGYEVGRIREILEEGTSSRNTARDLVQAITGRDPGLVF